MTGLALNSREIATAIWLTIGLIAAMFSTSIRSAILAAIRAFLRPVLVAATVCFGLYVAAVLVVADHIGLWQSRQLKDAVIWFCTAGLALLFSSHLIAGQQGWFRLQLKATLRLSVLIAVFLNFSTLPLAVELVFVPLLVLLAAMSAITDNEPTYATVGALIDWILAGIFTWLVIRTSWVLATGTEHGEVASLVADFGFAIWLPIAAIPFVFLLGTYSEYEMAWIKVRNQSEIRSVRVRSMLAILRTYGFHLNLVSRLREMEIGNLNGAGSWDDAIKTLDEHRSSINQEAAWRTLRDDRLARLRGVEGVDAEGCQIDREEFEQTKEALQMLSLAQSGWLREDGKFNSDLVLMFEPFADLPVDHGIELEVTSSGDAWMAYRATTTGWVFAIGGTKVDPEWLFEGPEEPTTFPGNSSEWPADLGAGLPDWHRPEGELFEMIAAGVIDE